MVRSCLQWVRPISYSHRGLREPGGGCPTLGGGGGGGGNRSGGTGGTYPGMYIFPDLSPRAKPYCGVKCSKGLRFFATNLYFLEK